jgi:hypothetical protein
MIKLSNSKLIVYFKSSWTLAIWDVITEDLTSLKGVFKELKSLELINEDSLLTLDKNGKSNVVNLKTSQLTNSIFLNPIIDFCKIENGFLVSILEEKKEIILRWNNSRKSIPILKNSLPSKILRLNANQVMIAFNTNFISIIDIK